MHVSRIKIAFAAEFSSSLSVVLFVYKYAENGVFSVYLYSFVRVFW